jgi:hypothetical protein
MTPTIPGFYWFTDDPKAPAQRIEVLLDDGELCARFEDEVEGTALLPVADLAGDFEAV